MENLCRVHINWEHFRHNVTLMQREGKTLMPVIKADAYGHGVVQAARELSRLGIRWAAIGTLQEGVLVRGTGFQGQVVALLGLGAEPDALETARRLRIVPLVHNWEDLRAMAEALRSGDEPMDIAIKVDSGMGRLGFPLSEMETVTEFLAEHAAMNPLLLLSHFSVADVPEEESYTRQQAEVFFRAAGILRSRFPSLLCSLGNTAGLLCHAELAGEICRPGISLYGYNPLFGTSREAMGKGLLPVMEVTAPLLSIHPLHTGESLGYGRTYIAPSERMVGWVGIGYADGYRRTPSPVASMCVKGVRVPVTGRVAMQMTCLDLTALVDKNGLLPVKPGDAVHVLGGGGDAVTAQDIALWWNTIPYEVTCLLGKNRTD